MTCGRWHQSASQLPCGDARVRLSHSGSRLCLVVEDDGRGFELNGARSGGLANIRDRVEALHGQLTIESRLGAGTSVRAELPEIGVVVLSQHTDESYARALFNDGSAGLAYLLKDRVGDLEDLVRALHEVASGGSVVDPLIIDTLVARQQTRASSPLASLTPRELDVLREMAQGKTNAGIEEALFLSESTVEKHVNAIFAKLGISAAPVHRRVVAVLAFLENAPASDRVDTTRTRP
ncbi:MAG TPA: LuxR C-terminal-related transcriptional regulator [Propionibacteriaceae bacterium]